MKKRCPARFVGVMLVMLLLVAACGREAEISAQQPADSQGQGGAVVTIGRLICGGHLSLAVTNKRFSDRLGFRLETVQNHSWDGVVADLESGRLDGTFILSPLAMELIRKGLAARIVLLADRNGNGFVLSSEVPSIGALGRGSHIIAVPHLFSQHHVLLHKLLEDRGVDASGISVVAMPPRDMINSLRRGEIDGFVVGEPEAHKSIELGVGWMASISPQIWRNHMDHVLLLTERFISEHPERVQRLVDSFVASGRFIEANPRDAARMGEDYTGSAAGIFFRVLTDPPDWIDYGDMMPTVADLRKMGRQMVKMGLWDSLPSDLDRYIDDRFARKAAGET